MIEYSESGDRRDLGLRMVQRIAAALGLSWRSLASAWVEWMDALEVGAESVIDVVTEKRRNT